MRSLIASGWHAEGVPVRSIVDAGAEDFAVPLGADWSRNVRMPGQVVSVAGFHDREAQGGRAAKLAAGSQRRIPFSPVTSARLPHPSGHRG